MHTSAINCKRSSNADKSEKSPDSWIFLASSAISFISLFIDLCQSFISSTGCIWASKESYLVSSGYFLFPALDPSHAHCALLVLQGSMLLEESRQHWNGESSMRHEAAVSLFPPNQVKMTFNTEKYQSTSQILQLLKLDLNSNLPAEGASLLELSCLSTSASPCFHLWKWRKKAMEGTRQAYSQECCRETARLCKLAPHTWISQ